MKQHELKIWPEFFDAIISGKKTFELRRDDRGFSLDDILWLREWSPSLDKYTGRETAMYVCYLLTHRPDAGCAATFGMQPGYVIMGIKWISIASVNRSGVDVGGVAK